MTRHRAKRSSGGDGAAPRISASLLGQALRIEYRRPGDKATRIHPFGPGVRVYAAKGGRHLIITGGTMNVRAGQIHG